MVWFSVLLVGLLVGCRERAASVTTVSQLSALTNLAVFAMPPVGASGMASTFDRDGGNVDWWHIPRPVDGRDLYEAFRADGPGCVTRIWWTNVPATEWLVFVDGETEPRLKMWPLPWGDFARGPDSPIHGSSSGGVYSYRPIPYARSISIQVRMPEIRNDARPYFHVNYVTYPAGTRVESWQPAPNSTRETALARANAAWKNTHAEHAALSARLEWRRIAIPARQSVDICVPQGRGTIRALGVRPFVGNPGCVMRSAMLRGLVLEGYWDGASVPSIQAPVGDFFLNGMHPRQFASLPMSHLEGSYLCRLPMPFRRGARLTIRNDMSTNVVIEAATEVVPGDPGDGLYLHASFNAATSTGAPFRIMRTTGRGKYVGCYLIALGMDGSWNILEGDERFFRDGNPTPVHHGTGLEDYFNGAWYYFGLCELPLHGLLEKAAMRTAQYRFHMTDPFDFQREMRMEIEFGAANRAGGYLSAVAYWYQDRPGAAGSLLPPVESRFPPIDRVGRQTIMNELFELERMGLIEDAMRRCEFYAAVWAHQPQHAVFRLRALAYREMLFGYAAVKESYAEMASNNHLPPEVVEQARLLHWRGEKPGRAIFGAHAFGHFRLLVNGVALGEGGGNPAVWRAWPVELPSGEHLLEAEVTPKHTHAFFSAGFSSFFTNVISDTSWDFLAENGAGSEAVWRPYEVTPGYFPTMAFWQFEPNAFPCVQSGQQQGGPFAGWTDPVGRTVRLRRRIRVPEPGTYGDRPPMPPRQFMVHATPVRPRDDTSNEGLSHTPAP